MKVDVCLDFVVPPLIVPTRALISAADMENSCFGNGVKLRYMGVSTHLTNRWSQPLAASSQHVYNVRPRKDKRGVNLISDVLPFGRIRASTSTWNDTSPAPPSSSSSAAS
jgi:hypothetical protein